MIQALLVKYAMQILAGLLAFSVVVGGYYYWKHDIVTAALTKQSAKLTEQSETLLKQKQHEVDLKDKENQERLSNAVQIYAKHYDDLRVAADNIPDRVYIPTKADSCSDTVPRASEGGPKVTPGSARVSKAELPQANIRELNKTISLIEAMQLKCERLLNELP